MIVNKGSIQVVIRVNIFLILKCMREFVLERKLCIYESACKRYGVIPYKQVPDDLETETLELTHRLLAAEEVKTLCVALVVCIFVIK